MDLKLQRSAHRSLHQTLKEAVGQLEHLGYKPRFSDFQTLISPLELDKSIVAPLVSFQAERYTRTLIYESDQVSVLLLGWLPNQSSPIHSHNGSLCATFVVQGTLTNRQFQLRNSGSQPQQLYLQFEEQLAEGSIAFLDHDGVHQALNTSSEPLVTLHIYSPRLQLTVVAGNSCLAKKL